MMRFLFVVPMFHTNLAYAVRGLLDAGHAVDLAVTSGGAPEGLDLPTPYVFDSGITFADALKLVKRMMVDVVVIRKSPGIDMKFYFAAVAHNCKMMGYDLRPFIRPRPFLSRAGRILKGRPKYRFTPVYGLPITGKPDRCARFLRLPVRPSSLPPAPRDGSQPIRLLCVGKLAERRKNHAMVLEAFKGLSQRHNVELTIVGSSSLDIGNPDPDTLMMLRNLSLRGVHLIEDVPFIRMNDVYASHDLLVFAASREPLGVSLPEAMAQGLAVVASSTVGTAAELEMARQSGLDCGAVFEDGNVDDLVARLEQYLVDPECLNRARHNSWQWARENFTAELFVRNFLKFF